MLQVHEQNVTNENSERIEFVTGSNKNLNSTDSIIESSQHEMDQLNRTGSDTSFSESMPENKSASGFF